VLPRVLPSAASSARPTVRAVRRADPDCRHRRRPAGGAVRPGLLQHAGQAKNTYGTGCFMLMHTGGQMQASANGLLSTAAAQTGATPQYALEGSVFIGGAVVQWLRDGLHAIRASHEVQAAGRQRARRRRRGAGAGLHRAGRTVLAADARGAIVGLTRGTRSRTSRAPRSTASPFRAQRCCRRWTATRAPAAARR
jgi:hypothetical protein